MTNPLEERRPSFATPLEVVLYRRAGDSSIEELLHAQLNVDNPKLGSGFCEDLDNSIADAAELALRPRDRSRISARSSRGTPVSTAQSLQAGGE